MIKAKRGAFIDLSTFASLQYYMADTADTAAPPAQAAVPSTTPSVTRTPSNLRERKAADIARLAEQV